jgi:hypothetical protein
LNRLQKTPNQPATQTKHRTKNAANHKRRWKKMKQEEPTASSNKENSPTQQQSYSNESSPKTLEVSNITKRCPESWFQHASAMKKLFFLGNA